jgi:hypothetical protein
LPMKVSVAEGCMTSSYFHTMMYEVTPMAGRQQGALKGWLFLPDVVSSLEPKKAISGMGALAGHSFRRSSRKSHATCGCVRRFLLRNDLS